MMAGRSQTLFGRRLVSHTYARTVLAPNVRQTRSDVCCAPATASLATAAATGSRSSDSAGTAQTITIPARSSSVKDTASLFGIRTVDVLKHMIKLGEEPHSVDQRLTSDMVELLGMQIGVSVIVTEEQEDLLARNNVDELPWSIRRPIVSVMGHVDHGKTTLLDTLRKTNVVDGEAGGITQHISSFEVDLGKGKQVVFLDTPGHQAFSAMRQRGANVTDVIILMVSATEGCRPQTLEVAKLAETSGVPVVVAINKCDLPDADPEMVKTDLLENGVILEEFGGEIQYVEVSAVTGNGLSELVDAVLLQSEMLELKGQEEAPAEGVVIELKRDKGFGTISNVIVRNGTLQKGDFFVCGQEYGRVRTLLDHNGKQVDRAPPSSPVSVVGLKGQPDVGQDLIVVKDEGTAKTVVQRRKWVKEARQARLARVSSQEEGLSVPLVVRCDVAGTVEAVVQQLKTLSNDSVNVKVLSAGVGPPSESDVELAESAGASIVCFSVRAPGKVARAARVAQVEVFEQKVIYHLIDEVKAKILHSLPAVEKEVSQGRAVVSQMFSIKRGHKQVPVAGCKVIDGSIRTKHKIKVIRGEDVIQEGLSIAELRVFKDIVQEVHNGMECGIDLGKIKDDSFELIEGDEIHAVINEASTPTAVDVWGY